MGVTELEDVVQEAYQRRIVFLGAEDAMEDEVSLGSREVGGAPHAGMLPRSPRTGEQEQQERARPHEQPQMWTCASSRTARSACRTAGR